MARFSFVHSADLHLGSPFQGLALKDAGLAAGFAEASRNAFSRLVSLAVERRVDFFLIAGDVYDGDWKDNKIGLFFNREVARLERAGIPVFLIKGNHDAVNEISRTIGLPGNVHEFPAGRPGTQTLDALKVALHGQSFLNQAETDNMVLDYPPALPGYFNIGLLHTSLTGREPHARYAPCSLADLKGRGYDYWALGHVHDHEVVSDDPPVIFPGNLQGRSVRECGAKGAVLVTVEDGRITHERVIVDEARFFELVVAVEVDDTEAVLLARIEAQAALATADLAERKGAIRVRLTGETLLSGALQAGRRNFADEVQAACHRCHHDLWLEKLELRLKPPARARSDTDAGVDLGALMAAVEDGDPELDAVLDSLLRESRIPPIFLDGIDTPADRAALIAEARALLLGMAGEG